jgi:hypothetical protein
MAHRMAFVVQRPIPMTRRPDSFAWLRRRAALVVSAGLCVLGCSAANHVADDHFAEPTGDAEISESQDGHADMPQDRPIDAASESPAVSCAAGTPMCAQGCQAQCGCFFCTEGEIGNVNGISVLCSGGCWVPIVDGGPDPCLDGVPITDPSARIGGAPPSAAGCYEFTPQCGWEKLQCNCELDVHNPVEVPGTVQFAFNVVPATVIPSLAGVPDVEISFDDPSEAWAATWSAQPGRGTTFAVAKAAGVTTVRLGATSIQLAAVSLPALQSTVATGALHGTPQDTALDMKASVSATADSSPAVATGVCFEIRPL